MSKFCLDNVQVSGISIPERRTIPTTDVFSSQFEIPIVAPTASTPLSSFILTTEELADLSAITDDPSSFLSLVSNETAISEKLVVISNLPLKLVNCNRLYNLLWQYGCVHHIAFIHGEDGGEGKQGLPR